MKRRKGYLLIENIVTLCIIMVILSILYYLLFFSINTKNNMEDRLELQQQSNEMAKYIEDLIGNSKGIINISPSLSEMDLLEVTSIKCKYKDTNINNSEIKDKELSLKKDKNKLFINTLNKYGNSESGGYEIGDYIDNMYIAVYENGNFANLKLKLSKNEYSYEKEFKIHIRNFDGDSI